MSLARINPTDVLMRPFYSYDKDWALVCVGDYGKMNAMTVSWGGLGTLWNKPVATIYIRQSRYTKEFLDAQDFFTINFMGHTDKKVLAYLGSVSGRDEDKIGQSGLTPTMLDGSLAFEEATLVFVCRKAFVGMLKPEDIVDPTVNDSVYADQDYHTMYIGYVEKAYHQD